MELYDKSMPVDGTQFIPWQETEQEILSRWKKEYHQLGFHKIVPYGTKDGIPNTYDLAKRKAPQSKSRLIRNCSVMGAARALKVACQALLFLLKQREKTKKSFNLQSVHDFPEVLQKKCQDLLDTRPEDQDAMLMFLAGDIADFYPNLPHDAIRGARNKIIEEAIGSTRS